MELLIGLKSLKDVGIFHRDIKPANFLYNPHTRKGIIIDFGLAEVDPTHQERFKAENRSLKRKPEKREYDLHLMLHNKLNDCLSSVGQNKIGTESYMPIESLLRHHRQCYESDIWPVGVILLSFVLRKYNPFNHITGQPLLDCKGKPVLDSKNTFLVYHLLQLATLLGK